MKKTAEQPTRKPTPKKAFVPPPPPRMPMPGVSAIPSLYPAGETAFTYLYDEMLTLAATLGVTLDSPVGIYPCGESSEGYLLRQLHKLEDAAGDMEAALAPLYPRGETLLSFFYGQLTSLSTGGGGGGGGGGTPGQPLNLVATTVSDTELNLTWDLADANDTAVIVERSNDGATGWVTVATLAGGWRTWTDRSLTPLVTRHYRVSTDGEALSDPSAAASATTAVDGSTAGNALTSPAVVADSAWQATLSWISPSISGDPKIMIERQDFGSGVFAIVAVINAVAGAQTFVDTPLFEGGDYIYRLRAANGSTYGAYTADLPVVTPDKGSGFPSVPPGIQATVNSGTSATILWYDSNDGNATTLVETAAVPGSGDPTGASFSQVTETSAGVGSYTLTTVANTPVYVRVRARMNGHNSAYTPPLVVRPASGAVTANTYEIGPGQNVETLGAFDWDSLKPGDTVNVHSGTYAEKLLINCRGAATNRITIQGVDDGGGFPVIDGLHATTKSTFTPSHTFEDLALVHFGKKTGQPNGHQAGYVTFQNFVLKRAYQANSPDAHYTAADGTTRSYIQGAAGIYFGRGDNITIQNCEITDCSNGIFGAADGADTRDLADISIINCYIHGNGTPAGFSEHNIYMEGARTTYMGNRITALRATSGGSCLKDRGPGLVVKANWIEGAARLLDVVETQNGITRFLKDPAYLKSYVWGNVFKNTGEASIPIHYGGDSSGDWYYRKGYLSFSHNTFVNRMDSSSQFRVSWFFVSAPSGVCVPTNNIYWVEKATGGGFRPEVDLFIDDTGAVNAIGLFGANFVTPGWLASRTGLAFTGKAAGTEAFFSPADNLPGFVSAATSDYHLTGGATVIGLGSRLPEDHPTINRQYLTDQDTEARSSAGTGGDLGAYGH